MAHHPRRREREGEEIGQRAPALACFSREEGRRPRMDGVRKMTRDVVGGRRRKYDEGGVFV